MDAKKQMPVLPPPPPMRSSARIVATMTPPKLNAETKYSEDEIPTRPDGASKRLSDLWAQYARADATQQNEILGMLDVYFEVDRHGQQVLHTMVTKGFKKALEAKRGGAQT